MENMNKIVTGLVECVLAAFGLLVVCLRVAAAIVVPAALIKLSWLFLLA